MTPAAGRPFPVIDATMSDGISLVDRLEIPLAVTLHYRRIHLGLERDHRP